METEPAGDDGSSLNQAAGRLISLFPQLDECEQTISLTLYRLLAAGEPVANERLARMVGLPVESVEGILNRWFGVYRDDTGAITAYWGLTLNPTRHRLHIGDRVLYTWCAWDSLFLPMLLNEAAQIESVCHETGTDVRLAVSPHKIGAAEPEALTVSFVLPDTAAVHADIIASFCRYVHFFRSSDAGRQWVARTTGALLLSLDDAFELGQRRNYAQYMDILK